MLRTPKTAAVWRRRRGNHKENEIAEPTIRRLELFIAFCGLLIASVTIYTSYLQYVASQSQADIAEATLSPQFSVRIAALPPKPKEGEMRPTLEDIGFSVVNDGGPAVNIRIFAATYVLLGTAATVGQDMDYFPLRAFPVRSTIVYSGAAKESVAAVSFASSNHEVQAYLDSMYRHARVRGLQAGGNFQHRVEVRYDTALGKSKIDLFEIDSFRWSIRKVTKWSWRPVDENLDMAAMILKPSSWTPANSPDDRAMTEYTNGILRRIDVKLSPPSDSD